MEIVFVLQPAAFPGELESDQPARSAGIGAALAFAAGLGVIHRQRPSAPWIDLKLVFAVAPFAAPAAFPGELESDQPAHSAGIGAALAFAVAGGQPENWKDLLNTWHLLSILGRLVK